MITRDTAMQARLASAAPGDTVTLIAIAIMVAVLVIAGLVGLANAALGRPPGEIRGPSATAPRDPASTLPLSPRIGPR
jgi:hypothetical protein